MARWPEIAVPDDYIGLFEANCRVLHSETAIKPGSILRKKRAALSSSTARWNPSLITLTALRSPLRVTENIQRPVCRLKRRHRSRLLPDLPVQPVRKVFSRSSRMAVTAHRINSRHLPGVTERRSVLPASRLRKTRSKSKTQWRAAISSLKSVNRSAHTHRMDQAFTFLRNILPGVGGLLYGAACTYDNTPDEDFIIDTCRGMTTRHSSPASAVMASSSPPCWANAAQFAQGSHRSLISPFSLSRF